MKRRDIVKKYNKNVGDTLSSCTKVELMFINWLSQNIARFNYRPKVSLFNVRNIYFEGIIKQVQFVLEYDFPLVEMSLYLYDRVSDCPSAWCLVAGIDKLTFDEERGWFDDVNGFSQSQIIDPKDIKYFETIEELASYRIFEPFLDFCNTHLTEQKSLYIVKYDYQGSKDCGSEDISIAWTDETRIQRYIRDESTFSTERGFTIRIKSIFERYDVLKSSEVHHDTEHHMIIKYNLVGVGNKPDIRYLRKN